MDATMVAIDENGRLVVPAAYRRALGLGPGSRLLVRLEHDGLRLQSPEQALAAVRNLVRPYLAAQPSASEELLNDRRAEAESE